MAKRQCLCAGPQPQRDANRHLTSTAKSRIRRYYALGASGWHAHAIGRPGLRADLCGDGYLPDVETRCEGVVFLANEKPLTVGQRLLAFTYFICLKGASNH